MRLHTRAEAQDLPGADLHTSDDRQPAILGPKHDANLVRRDARSSQARQRFPPALELQSANLDVGQLRMKGTASKKGVQAVASSDGSLVLVGISETATVVRETTGQATHHAAPGNQSPADVPLPSRLMLDACHKLMDRFSDAVHTVPCRDHGGRRPVDGAGPYNELQFCQEINETFVTSEDFWLQFWFGCHL